MTDLLITIAIHSLWIGGLATVLAVVSYGYHQAQIEERSLRELFVRPDYATGLWLGATLVGLGLLATSSSFIEGAAWLLLSAFSLFSLLSSARTWRAWASQAEDKRADGGG